MKKIILVILLVVTVMSVGCNSKHTTIKFNKPDMERETTTFTPVNEQQHLSGFSQVNITELEGLNGITEADIFLPVPNEAIWDADTKTYTMPGNLVNENGESFIMTITLEELPNDISASSVAQAAKEEVENLLELDRAKYGGSWYRNEKNVVVKSIKETILDEPLEDGETTETLKKTIKLDIEAYDFLVPTFALSMKIEIIKTRGTVDETTEAYIGAVISALDKLRLHYQEKV